MPRGCGPNPMDASLRESKAVQLELFFYKGVTDGNGVMQAAKGLYASRINRCATKAHLPPHQVSPFLRRLKSFQSGNAADYAETQVAETEAAETQDAQVAETEAPLDAIYEFVNRCATIHFEGEKYISKQFVQ